jgi:hypothetical protein
MQVSKIDLLNKLEQSGLLKQLIASGVLPYSIIQQRDIFKFVEYQRQVGSGTKEAVEQAEIEFEVSASTVYRAIRSFAVKSVIAESNL